MIKDLINKHLPKAFDSQLKDAVQPFTGYRKGFEGAYDPATDSYTGGGDINYAGRGVFGNYKDYEVKDTEIKLSDTKLTCLQIEVSEPPQVDDVITLDKQQLRVLNVQPDPTNTIWIVQLRGLKARGFNDVEQIT